MKFYKLENIGILIFLINLAVFPQQAYFGYLEEPTDPRSIALGSAGTAGCNGGFSFYNPANIGIIDAPFISFEYGMIWGDISRGIIEGGWGFRNWFVGTSFQTQSNSFIITDATGNYISGATGIEQASMISLIGGIRRERFSVGLSVNGLYHRIFDVSSSAISLSGGANFSIVPNKLRGGLSIINAGRYHKNFYGSNYIFSKDLMPTTARIGIIWKDTLRNTLPIILSLDVVYEKNYDLITVPAGFELWPIPYLALRIGKCFFLQTELFTSGIGIKWENLSFDASFVPYSIGQETLIKWNIALRYELKMKKQVKKSTSHIEIQKEAIIKPIEEKRDSLPTLLKVDSLKLEESKVESKVENNIKSSPNKVKDSVIAISPSDSIQSDLLKVRNISEEVQQKREEELKGQDPSTDSIDKVLEDTKEIAPKEDVVPIDTLKR